MADAILINETIEKVRGDGVKLAAGTSDCTNATGLVVATGLSVITSIIGCSINVKAGTIGDGLTCIKSVTAGSLVITAVGASGTTTANWAVLGY